MSNKNFFSPHDASAEQSMTKVPEPGQMVEVRRRLWSVIEVKGGSFGEDCGTSCITQHIVSLSSLEDDSLGEEIEVVWELEPGARVLERAGLPEFSGIDEAERLEAFLDAVRWGAVTHADRALLQAPFRSGITIEDYQLDPLVRAIDMVRTSLLIADDVGLGKTIEAGLVIRELLLRHRARTVLIVCPASLQIKWQEEMRDKFGLDFRIVDTDYLKWLRRTRGIHANPWTSYPRLITSIDWAKLDEPLRAMKDALPLHPTYPRRFDILVVDEAHNVAPATASQYAIESRRTRFIRTIAPHFEHKLFLSATPHNGYQESFTALLELLDDRRFARTVRPNRKQLDRVMVRRLKTDLVDANGNPIYPTRRLIPLEVHYTDEERKIHGMLQRYTKSRIARLRGTRYLFGTEFVLKLLKKRLFSSPAAFRRTLVKYIESLERSTSDLRSEYEGFEERILRRVIARTEEEYADDESKERVLDEAVEASSRMVPPLTDEERKLLDVMRSWAERNAERVDAKAKAILEWIENHLIENGEWNDQRVILFTEYLDTHRWLHQILTSYGYGGDRLMTLHGGMSSYERERVKAAFQAHPSISPVRILLATDAASEGIDLQNHCNKLIHVEIPWNPNVMEQRNGRIDRHGQREREVLIWHPVGKAYEHQIEQGGMRVGRLEGDTEFLMRAVQKVDAIREDLGSVGPVIARQIEEAMLGKREDLDTSLVEDRVRSVRRLVSAERRLRERISRLHERLLETRKELRLTPERVLRAVQVGLELAGQPSLIPTKLPGIPNNTVFHVPVLQGSWAKCTEGLRHPHTGERRPITFDHEVAEGRDDVVLVHLDHPLVQMCLRLLRAEIWAREDVKRLHRMTIASLPDDELETPMAVVWFRLVITGGDYNRLHEELTLAGGFLRHDRFTREARVTVLQRLVEEARPLDSIRPSDRLFAVLTERFKRHESSLLAAMEARSRERVQYLTNTLERRKEQDIRDIGSVLDELAYAIERELAEHEKPMQFTLWTEEEKRQYQRDLENLRPRLERIPEEKKRETEMVMRRYSDLRVHTFPVAVVFLVPESIGQEN